MRNVLLALAAAVSLTGCATLPAPATVANVTVLDERIGIAATVGYTAASTLGNRLSRLGVIPRPAFQALDQRGYTAVRAIRAAYLAGNATSYLAAVEQAKAATASIGELVSSDRAGKRLFSNENPISTENYYPDGGYVK